VILISISKRPATWGEHYDTSKEHIIWSVENSWNMFHTDRLELLLIHRPDPLLDPHEVAEAFSQLQKTERFTFRRFEFHAQSIRMLQSIADASSNQSD